MKKCYKIKLEGHGLIKYTDSEGRRKVKKYFKIEKAKERLDLEKRRGGWKGKIIKC